MTELQRELFSMSDSCYRDFHARLMPNIDKARIIGIRTPVLRKFAAEFSKDSRAAKFVAELPHEYYEENNLHAFLIEKIKDFDRALFETERFLPYVDNWATCDMFMPKVFAKNKDKIAEKALEWINSPRPYTVRYGIGILMKLFLDEDFKPEYMDKVSRVRSDEYYVNMMIAWYFATALAKQYDCAAECIENLRLDTWVHNKAIQKAVESRRISEDTKRYLKTLKR